MNPFEDRISEERLEPQEAVRHIEERLASVEEHTTSLAERTPEVDTETFVFRSQSRAARQSPVLRVVSALVVVLVVGILIGSAVLLFAQRMHSPAGTGRKSGTTGQTGTPDSVDGKWDGLEMSMRVTPGPYFLGELLAVDVSLTNHTQPTLLLGGSSDGSEILPYSCGTYSLRPELTGGTNPHYVVYTEPVRSITSCPDQITGRALHPGQTITDHFYSLLTSSGDVTLTGRAFVYLPQSNFNPLIGHLPVLHLRVAPQVPADRVLSLQLEDSKVVIHAPAGIQPVERTYIICQPLPQSSGSGVEASAGNESWQTLSADTLQRPECSPTGSGWAEGQWTPPTQFTIVLWDYAIGAAGYEVAQGQQEQYSGQHFP